MVHETMYMVSKLSTKIPESWKRVGNLDPADQDPHTFQDITCTAPRDREMTLGLLGQLGLWPITGRTLLMMVGSPHSAPRVPKAFGSRGSPGKEPKETPTARRRAGADPLYGLVMGKE